MNIRMTVLCIISVFYSHAASAMLAGSAMLPSGSARSTDASGASLDGIVKSGDVKIEVAPATPAGGSSDDGKYDTSDVEIELADGVRGLSLHGVRARSASMAPDDSKFFRLIHVIDCPEEKDIDEVKFLVIACGIDDDFYTRAGLKTTFPTSQSPFWHALALLVDDKEPSGDKYKTRFEMLKILAGLTPGAAKRPTIPGTPLHYLAQQNHVVLAAFILDNNICNPNRYHTDNMDDPERHTALFDATTDGMIELLVRRGVVPLFAGALWPEKMGYFKLARNGRSWEILREGLVPESKYVMPGDSTGYVLPDRVSAQAEFRSLLRGVFTGHEPFRERNNRELMNLLLHHGASIKTLLQFPSRDGEMYGIKVGPLKFVVQYADKDFASYLLGFLLDHGIVWLGEDDLLDSSCEKLVGGARAKLIASDSYKRIPRTCCCSAKSCSLTKQIFIMIGGLVMLGVTATGIVYDHSK